MEIYGDELEETLSFKDPGIQEEDPVLFDCLSIMKAAVKTGTAAVVRHCCDRGK